MNWTKKDLLGITELTKEEILFILDTAESFKEVSQRDIKKVPTLRGKTVITLFYEPSTRTRMSFEAAISSIGGSSIGITDPKSSSIEKGESLSDTIRIMDLYSDVLVLRHPLDGSGRFASELSKNPVINAGSGSEEHPTQAMLDLYTIYKEKKRIDGLRIGIIGDLKYGRTVYSLLYGLASYNVTVHLISPPTLHIREESIGDISKSLSIYQHTELDDDILSKLDIIYVTRIQKERFPDMQEYEKVRGTFTIDRSVLERAKSNVTIMHPMPRMDEISHSVDSTKNAAYFKQAGFGRELRAALLALVLNENPF